MSLKLLIFIFSFLIISTLSQRILKEENSNEKDEENHDNNKEEEEETEEIENNDKTDFSKISSSQMQRAAQAQEDTMPLLPYRKLSGPLLRQG